MKKMSKPQKVREYFKKNVWVKVSNLRSACKLRADEATAYLYRYGYQRTATRGLWKKIGEQ